MIREVAAHRMAFVEGIGEDPSGKWPGERSLLVFGLVPKIAREFGAKFGQNAIVWSGADAIPQDADPSAVRHAHFAVIKVRHPTLVRSVSFELPDPKG